MRKQKHPEHVNHERWLVSYADFITLLFAFFVVMFAVSQVDSNKLGRFSESFSEAVGAPLLPAAGAGILPHPAPPPDPGHADEPALPAELEKLRTDLVARALSKDDLAGLKVLRRGRELVLRLPDHIVFESGNDRLRPEARRMLATIADELRERPVDLRVEGHTDNVPIRTTRFRSNWELSTARATAVIAELVDAGRLGPVRLSAAGYGEFHPLESNESPEGRLANRRVDVVVTPTLAPVTEHPATAP